MEGSHLKKKKIQKLDSAILSPTKTSQIIQRHLQETLLLSHQQNPNKESKEDEEKWRMSGLFIEI